MTSSRSTAAASTLALEVFTTPARTFVSASTPEGPGDDPTWSPSSATLIYGERDAVLVDIPATDAQVDAVADWIESKGRALSRVYITHGHGDHWLGLARLAQRFPGVYGLASAEVLARAEIETANPAIASYWDSIFPGEVPDAGNKVLPRLLDGDTIELEGNALQVLHIGQSDTADSTVLHVPALAAVITGDLAYNEVHMMTAETGPSEREQWIANLGQVAALDPAIVVAGHKKVERADDPAIVAQSQQYLRDFSEAASEHDTAAAIVAAMVARYPDWQNVRTLWHSARVAVGRRLS
jgi:glyoxylase-like metal-dependent hydrolase (beta-lactamase superfamily II)